MGDVKRLQKLNETDDAWIGLQNSESHNVTWHWSLPSVEYDEKEIKWRKGQPDDDHSDENCVMMENCENHRDKCLGDFPCSEKGFFICYDGKSM